MLALLPLLGANPSRIYPARTLKSKTSAETCSLTKKAEPPPTCDANRDSGTDSANCGWLRRLVRRHIFLQSIINNVANLQPSYRPDFSLDAPRFYSNNIEWAGEEGKVSLPRPRTCYCGVIYQPSVGHFTPGFGWLYVWISPHFGHL